MSEVEVESSEISSAVDAAIPRRHLARLAFVVHHRITPNVDSLIVAEKAENQNPAVDAAETTKDQ